MHSHTYLPTPAECLMNYWTWRTFEEQGFMWLSSRHENALSSRALNRQNGGWIRQRKHWVNDGAPMKYLHPRACEGEESVWALQFGVEPDTYNSPLCDLKSKTGREQEKKKTGKEMTEGRAGWEREGENLGLGIFCCSQSVTKGKILL